MPEETQLHEILSWRIMTELWRRFPDRFLIMETQSYEGQYDCLNLLDRLLPERSFISINRRGSMLFHCMSEKEAQQDWGKRFLSDASGYLNEIITAMGLEKPRLLPSCTASTLCFRYVSMLLKRRLGSKSYWECRMGSLATPGWGGGVHENWFQMFESTRTEPQVCPLHPQMHYTSCYWFILRDKVPILCVDLDGRLHRLDGKAIQLPVLYAKSRKVWSLITATAMDYLC